MIVDIKLKPTDVRFNRLNHIMEVIWLLRDILIVMFMKKYHWILTKNVFQKLKSFAEKHRSNLTKREVDYLTNFKWQSSNIYCAPRVHKFKTTQEAIATSNDD